MFSGGIVGILGTFIIHFVLYLSVNFSEADFWKNYPPITLSELTRYFLVGFVSLGIIASFLVPRILGGSFESKHLIRWGAFFGAVAGFLNFIILFSSGIIRSVDDIQLVLRDLHIVSIIFGVPAALIGALAGMAVAIILRRFVTSKYRLN